MTEHSPRRNFENDEPRSGQFFGGVVSIRI